MSTGHKRLVAERLALGAPGFEQLIDFIDTDTVMAAASDNRLPTQRAIKQFTESYGGGGGVMQKSKVTSIDLKTVAQTPVFTVPSGDQAIIESIDVVIEEADTATVVPTVQFGPTADPDELVGPAVLDPGMDTAGTLQRFTLVSDPVDGDVQLEFGVTGAGAATGNYTATVIVRYYRMIGQSQFFKLTEDTTVNLASSLTAAQIQATLDSLPMNLGGYDLTIQKENGTSALDATIEFGGFYNGRLFVQGDTTEGDMQYTTQAAIMDFAGNACHGLNFRFCKAAVTVRNLRVNVDNGYSGMIFNRSDIAGCRSNYVNSGGVTDGNCYYFLWSHGYIVNCLMTQGVRGIYSLGGYVWSWLNDDSGTPPSYGLDTDAGIIFKGAGSQPAGGIMSERENNGGQIFA
jgi:hypothetical protein